MEFNLPTIDDLPKVEEQITICEAEVDTISKKLTGLKQLRRYLITLRDGKKWKRKKTEEQLDEEAEVDVDIESEEYDEEDDIPLRQKIISTLDNPSARTLGYTITTIAARTGEAWQSVRAELKKLVKEGLVESFRQNYYRLRDKG